MIITAFGAGRSCLMINIISVEEASEKLKVSKAAIYKLITSGALKAFKIGVGGKTSSWRVSEDSLYAYIRSFSITGSSFLQMVGRHVEHKNKRKMLSLLLLRYYRNQSVSDVTKALKISTTTYFTWENFILSCVSNIPDISYADIKDDLGALRIYVRAFMR